MRWTPDSWGSAREANGCHEPRGSEKGGQFCSGEGRSALPPSVAKVPISDQRGRMKALRQYTDRRYQAVKRSNLRHGLGPRMGSERRKTVADRLRAGRAQ